MSVDPHILVTYGRISEAAQHAQEAASFMDGQFEHLKQELARLSVWNGPAAESYRALQADWDAAAEEMSQILKAISQDVVDINTRYRTAESRLAEGWT